MHRRARYARQSPEPLPNDPLGRWWVRAGQDQPIVTRFKQCLLALIVFGPAREPRLIGSAFVIGHGGALALAMTAGHVFTEGVYPSQRPAPRHAPSSSFVPPNWSPPSLDSGKLMALWIGPGNSVALSLRSVSYNYPALDISCFLATPQRTGVFQPATIPLSIEVPQVNDVVWMVSNAGLECTGIAAPFDRDGNGHPIQIGRRVSARMGVVTGVYPDGFRQYRWPCFTTSIPVRGGMSGGFVYVPREGAPTAACGIICADHSEPEAHLKCTVAGESVVACAWPGLTLSMPTRASRDPPLNTLYEMMQSGAVPAPIEGLESIEAIHEPDGEFTMRVRTLMK